MTKMVEVTQEDANNYCRVLAALGMEEEGDPVAEIERLKTELLCAREDVKKWRGLAEVARVLANLEDRRTVRASRLGLGA